MKWNDFLKKANSKSAVILLEGRRSVLPEDVSKLVSLGKMLAEKLPQATFRSGNASGSDEAFAQGVASVDPKRMQLITPYTTHRAKHRPEGSYSVGLEELPKAEEPKIYYETSKASPKNKGPVDYLQANPGAKSGASQKARYLIRDTVKVLGSVANGLQPATIGLFYTDPKDKYAGGTGHTIRVCEQNNVPVVTQIAWYEWLIS